MSTIVPTMFLKNKCSTLQKAHKKKEKYVLTTNNEHMKNITKTETAKVGQWWATKTGTTGVVTIISKVWWIGIRDIINKALELIDNYYVDKNCQGKECWATEAGNILSCTKFIRNLRGRKVFNIYLYYRYIGTGQPMIGNLQVL